MVSVPSSKSRALILLAAMVLLALVLIMLTVSTWMAPPSGGPLADRAPPSLRIEDAPPPASETRDMGVREAEEEPLVGGLVILECSGAPAAVGFVSLANHDDALRTVREGLRDGLARLAVPQGWFDGSTSIRLEVGVAGSGVRKTVRTIDLRRGETKEVAIRPEPGLALCGRLLDSSDSCIPGVWIVGRVKNMARAKQTSIYDSDDLLYSAHPFLEARAKTEEDGRFRLSGLKDQAYFLTTSDPRWVITPAERPPMTPPMEEIRLRAVRSYQFHLSIRDSESTKLIPDSRARIRLRWNGGGSYFTCGLPKGRNTVVWPPQGSAMLEESGFSFSVEVSAFGYESRHVTVRYPPLARAVSHTVELTPTPMGELVLDVVRAGGESLAGKVTVEISGSAGSYVFTLKKGEGPAGAFAQRVPAGSWEVRVFPHMTVGRGALAWKQRVTVPAGGVANAQVRLVPFGSLAVKRGKHKFVLLEIKMVGRRAGTVVHSKNPRLHAIQAGVWPYVAKIVVDGRWQEFRTGTIEVREGEESVLAIE